MSYAFSPAPTRSLAIAGSAPRFPVNRIFCVGRNYAAHAREMGQDAREPPFFFMKPAQAAVDASAPVAIAYPPHTKNFHHEIELVVAIGAGGAIVNALPTTDPVSDSGGAPNVGGIRPGPLTPVPNGTAAAGDATDEVVTGTLGDTLDGVRDAISNFGLQVTLDGTAGVTPAADATDTSLTASLDGTAATLDRPAPDAAVGGVGSGFWPVGVAPTLTAGVSARTSSGCAASSAAFWRTSAS